MSTKRRNVSRFFLSPANSCSLADVGRDLDLWYIENILTDYDSQPLQTSESS